MADLPFARPSERGEAYILIRVDPERLRRNTALINSIASGQSDA